ncbi:grasp-with-spasm system SPASM domain peptide maturase [Belliella pelovolcani]|uniref:SPASM domain peptide maturase, grasp-with-spasm system n=1 Tax=Belliella pelovolcani TaxID=529505 RepID=A0A1N7Q4T6_9BACT|nr:grasp-with-spasm system SPASM domain peptide maturase [Belliella pelovolcani]SIT17826.1 SPASM domain peptide maturase, grasp-with-spasm system [Belliella pelovolcani]
MSKMNFNEPYFLYTNCIPVKGFNRSIIYDLQREDYEFIPNDLYQILKEFNGKTINDIIKKYGKNNISAIEDYFLFLIEKEYVFFSNLSKSHFPPLDMEFSKPYKISTIVIDIDSDSYVKYIDTLIYELKTLGCGAISLRFLNKKTFSISLLENILEKFKDLPTRSIEIWIPSKGQIKKAESEILDNICLIYQRVYRVNVYGHIESFSFLLKKSYSYLCTYVENLEYKMHALPSLENMVVNLELFCESQNFNSYYNGKIFVDKEGYYFQTLFSDQSFGNVASVSLQDLIKLSEFKKYSIIKKDDIKVCMDCEFRYMCSDSRIPEFKIKENQYEHTTLCNYSPYSNSWIN